MDCLFCRIVSGEVPSYMVYEDEAVVSFLDIFPANAGHALVVPRVHYEGVSEVPGPEMAKLAVAVQKVAGAIKAGYGLEGLNILVNEGKVAGQLIPHLHVHVIPRFPKDGVATPSGASKASEEELEKAREVIRKHIK